MLHPSTHAQPPRLSQYIQDQVLMRTTDGGAGYTSAQLMFPAAYLGSWAQSKKLVQQLLPTELKGKLDTLSSNQGELWEHIRGAYAAVSRAHTANDLVMVSVNELERAPTKAQ